MFSRLGSLLAAAIYLFALVGPASAQYGYDRSDKRTIAVTGEAEVKVTPDEVIVVLGVETDNLDISLAKTDNDERVQRILAIAKEFGVPDKYVQTDRISVDPRYYTEHGGKRTFLGYWIYKTMTITLRGETIPAFDDILTNVLAAGANYVTDVEFRTTELRKYRDEARSMAVKAAHEKARDLAADLGHTVGEARSVREGKTGWYSWYNYRGRSRNNYMSQNITQIYDDAGSIEGAIALGKISVTASISVTFELQ